MEDVNIRTDSGGAVTLNEAALKTLQVKLSGQSHACLAGIDEHGRSGTG